MDLYSGKNVEKHAEFQSAIFLLDNGIFARPVQKNGITRCPDHVWVHGQTAFETSVLHPYTPEIVQNLYEIVDKKLGIDTRVFVYGDENYKVKTLILGEGKCQPNISILRTQYDASAYANKIHRKIEEEYYQISLFKSGVLILYHTTSPFDPLSLSMVYSQVLSDYGQDFPKLSGVLVALPNNLHFPLTVYSYFFVENPHSPLYPPTQLEKFWKIPKSKVFVRPFSYYTYFKGKRGMNKLTYPPPHP